MAVLGLALVLLAAACGTEVAPTVNASSGSESTEGSAATTSSDAAPSSADTAEDTAEEVAGPAPAADHLFPDINTLDIVDGSTVNLAQELAGGDTPVLLWFWAPH
jgi:hypothetical protein